MKKLKQFLVEYYKQEKIKHVTIGAILLAILSVVIAIETKVDLNTDKDMIRYMFSAGAQVIATVFGLTLATVTFYYENLNKEKKLDDTLDEIVTEIKLSFYNSLISISIYFIIGISVSMVNIYVGNLALSNMLLSVLIALGTSINLVVIILIILMITRVLNPNLTNLVVNSKNNKKTGDNATMENFLKLYNNIESSLLKILKDKYPNYSSNNKNILNYNKAIINQIFGNSTPLFYEMKKVRNFQVHSEFINITKKDIENLNKLKSILDNYMNVAIIQEV